MDRFCSPQRQTALLRSILHFVARAEQALEHGVELAAIRDVPVLRQLQRASEDIPEDKLERFRMLMRKLDEEFDRLAKDNERAR